MGGIKLAREITLVCYSGCGERRGRCWKLGWEPGIEGVDDVVDFKQVVWGY